MSVKRYLRSFNDHSDYEEYMDSSDLVIPNVSYCRQENEVHYNAHFVIEFASDWVKEQLLTLGIDQNEDGEIDTQEASQYRGGFYNLFNYNASGKPEASFNEFRFFTGMTGVHNYTFTGWTQLTSVMIPNSVTRIGDYAFDGCTSLTSITIPDSVTNISYSTFHNCTSLPVENYIRYADTCAAEATDKTLTTYQIKSGTRYIGGSAFTYCTNLTNITIPDSVTVIGSSAFYGCTSLTSITIPDSVIGIGQSAFNNCTSLPVENYIRYADTCAAEVTTKTLTTYQIKSGTRHIGGSAFTNCTNLTNITIPDSVTSIGGNAFSTCTNLTSITIPDSVTIIGDHAFQYCTSLTSITIPNSVTSIGEFAFYSCSGLTSVTVLAETPPTLDSSAFSNNASGRKIYVPAGSVNTYKYASGWSDYASDIEAIPTA